MCVKTEGLYKTIRKIINTVMKNFLLLFKVSFSSSNSQINMKNRINRRKSGMWSRSVVSDTLLTPWTVAYQVLPFMGFSRQEYWSGLPLSSPGDLSDPGSNPGLPHCRQVLQHLSHQGSPKTGEKQNLILNLWELHKHEQFKDRKVKWNLYAIPS